MKRAYWLRLVSSSLIMIILLNPVPAPAGFASGISNPVSAQNTVIASAVIVPAQVAELGFRMSAIAREIPVKEGDIVKAGQPLVVLNTPELQFAVVEAEAALRSAQSYANLQKYKKVENRRNGKVFLDTVPAVYRERANVKVQQMQAALEIIALFNNTVTPNGSGGYGGGISIESSRVANISVYNNIQRQPGLAVQGEHRRGDSYFCNSQSHLWTERLR